MQDLRIGLGKLGPKYVAGHWRAVVREIIITQFRH